MRGSPVISDNPSYYKPESCEGCCQPRPGLVGPSAAVTTRVIAAVRIAVAEVRHRFRFSSRFTSGVGKKIANCLECSGDRSAPQYPFQVAQWQAGIDTGVGSQMGGTSQTQGPQPNPLAQYGGLGLAGLMMLSDIRAKRNVQKIGETSFCRERQNSTAESAFPAFFGGKFCLPVRGAMSLI
jgi:hypothetical protein